MPHVLTSIGLTTILTGATIVIGAQTSTQDRPGNRDIDTTPRERNTLGDRDAKVDQKLEPLKALAGNWDVEMSINRRAISELSPASGSRPAAGGTQKVTGSAERSWELNGNILQERLSFKQMGALNGKPDMQDRNRTPGADRDPNNPDRERDLGIIDPDPHDQDADADNENRATNRNLRDNRDVNKNRNAHDMQGMHDNYKGMGIFCYDDAENQFAHVWTDTMKSGVVLSLGTYNQSDRTFTFREHYGKGVEQGPGVSSRDRSKPGINDRNPQQPLGIEESQPGSRSLADNTSEPIVTLRIINDNKHVVRMTKQDPIRGTVEEYEITYTRKGASPPTQPGMGTGTGNTNR